MAVQAYHNDAVQKAKYISIMEKAVAEKRLVSGEYWCAAEEKGCLVGTIGHEEKHEQFALEIQTPLWFPHLLDTVFEGLPDGKRQQFAMDVMDAIPIGFENWQPMYHKFCVFILTQVCKNTDHPLVRQAIADIVVLHRNQETSRQRWSTARSTARSAAWSATDAAAWSAARSADAAAWSAARSADAATDAATWSVADAARSAAYLPIATEIVRLLKEEDYSQ